MVNKIIHIDGVVMFYSDIASRARNLNLSIRPFAGARVSVPIGMSYNSAVQLVNERKLWIKKHLAKTKESGDMQTHFNENSAYSTKHHKLNLFTLAK